MVSARGGGIFEILLSNARVPPMWLARMTQMEEQVPGRPQDWGVSLSL